MTAMLPSIGGNSDSHIADELAGLVHGHGILHHDGVGMRGRWGSRRGRRSVGRRPGRGESLSGERQTHVVITRHRDGGDELAERAFDALSAVRVHERHAAPATIDVRDLRRLHSQVDGVATRALHTCSAAHVHKQGSTTGTHQLRHLRPVSRHLRHRVTKRASHIARAVRIHQQRPTSIANQLPLLLHLRSLPLLSLPLHRLIWHLPISLTLTQLRTNKIHDLTQISLSLKPRASKFFKSLSATSKANNRDLFQYQQSSKWIITKPVR